MIVENYDLQCLQCTGCGDVLELTRRTAGAPEVVFLLKEQMQKDHQPCDEWPDNPSRARAERIYRQQMAAELAPMRPRRRCQSRPADQSPGG